MTVFLTSFYSSIFLLLTMRFIVSLSIQDDDYDFHRNCSVGQRITFHAESIVKHGVKAVNGTEGEVEINWTLGVTPKYKKFCVNMVTIFYDGSLNMQPEEFRKTTIYPSSVEADRNESIIIKNICAERAYFRMEFMLNNTQHTNSLGFMKNIDLPHCPYDFPWSFLILGLLAVSLCGVFIFCIYKKIKTNRNARILKQLVNDRIKKEAFSNFKKSLVEEYQNNQNNVSEIHEKEAVDAPWTVRVEN